MLINSETFKKLRKSKGFSQQTLADESGVAKKTIARIESAKEKGEPRGETVKLLAKAMRVEPEILAQEPESETVREQELQKIGLRPVKLVLDGETILAYGLVADQYGVETTQILKAAPMFFTLLAEMSLNERRRRLEEMEKNSENFPGHFHYIPDYESAFWAEKSSVNSRDLFARHIATNNNEFSYWGGIESYFFEEARNPFNDFLIEQAKNLGPDNEAIDPEEIENFGNFDDLPIFNLFEKYRKSLTGGSARADYALSHGGIRISKIPKELRGEDEYVTSRRVKWLEEKVSDEDWDNRLKINFDIDKSPEEGDTENV